MGVHSQTASMPSSSSEQNQADEESFLSVSPSMLNSSLFEALTPPSVEGDNSSNNGDVSKNDKNGAIPQTAQELRDDEALAKALQQIENGKEATISSDGDNNTLSSTWHDRSAFE